MSAVIPVQGRAFPHLPFGTVGKKPTLQSLPRPREGGTITHKSHQPMGFSLCLQKGFAFMFLICFLHSVAVTATQLGSNQPHHSHCMSVVMCDYTLYTHIRICMYVFTYPQVWTLRLRELWVASQVNTS